MSRNGVLHNKLLRARKPLSKIDLTELISRSYYMSISMFNRTLTRQSGKYSMGANYKLPSLIINQILDELIKRERKVEIFDHVLQRRELKTIVGYNETYIYFDDNSASIITVEIKV